jgi:hypothetical protein
MMVVSLTSPLTGDGYTLNNPGVLPKIGYTVSSRNYSTPAAKLQTFEGRQQIAVLVY